jgi:Regulator of chromosome condensation (RCC1) repeat
VSVSNTVIGTVASNGLAGASLEVSLNTNATPARVQVLARALTFANSSRQPSESPRDVLVTLTDGDGGYTAVGNYVNVLAVNQPPSFTLTVGYGQTNSASVVAWGDNSAGQTNLPAGLGDVASISAGYEHALALRTDGTVVAWGLNNFGQSNVPPGLTNVAAISAGNFHSLALLSNGTVVAWGGTTPRRKPTFRRTSPMRSRSMRADSVQLPCDRMARWSCGVARWICWIRPVIRRTISPASAPSL